jgi:hypothetical protein
LTGLNVSADARWVRERKRNKTKLLVRWIEYTQDSGDGLIGLTRIEKKY